MRNEERGTTLRRLDEGSERAPPCNTAMLARRRRGRCSGAAYGLAPVSPPSPSSPFTRMMEMDADRGLDPDTICPHVLAPSSSSSSSDTLLHMIQEPTSSSPSSALPGYLVQSVSAGSSRNGNCTALHCNAIIPTHTLRCDEIARTDPAPVSAVQGAADNRRSIGARGDVVPLAWHFRRLWPAPF